MFTQKITQLSDVFKLKSLLITEKFRNSSYKHKILVTWWKTILNISTNFDTLYIAVKTTYMRSNSKSCKQSLLVDIIRRSMHFL